MSSPVRSILIVRLSAIGDVVFSTSLLPGLRARYPEARLVWLTEELGGELLRGHPLIDEVRVLPRRAWRRSWASRRFWSVGREVLALRRWLRDQRFDLAIDPQGLLKSASWAWVAGARRRVVLDPRDGASWLATETVTDEAGTGGRLCREYRVLAAHLGLPPRCFAMSLHPDADRVAVARQRLRETSGDRPLALLFPFTTRPQKHWFEDRWSALADALSGDGLAPWILGGPDDGPAARRIADGAARRVEIVAGPDSDLREKTAFTSLASVAIGVDTGLTHLGLALRCPTVALFGSTCPYVDTSPAPGRVLCEDLDCSPCRRRPTCDDRFDCMRAHTVERVLEAVRSLRAPEAPPS